MDRASRDRGRSLALEGMGFGGDFRKRQVFVEVRLSVMGGACRNQGGPLGMGRGSQEREGHTHHLCPQAGYSATRKG